MSKRWLSKINVVLVCSMASVVLAATAVWLSLPVAQDAPLLGLPDDHLVSYQAAAAAYPESFAVDDDASGAENAKKNVRLWRVELHHASKEKQAGQFFSCGPQRTGDCVSWGLARCIENLQAQQVYRGQGSHLVDVFRPALYGIAKVNFSRAGPVGQGAYPDVAIKAWQAMGYLTSEDNPPPYSGRLADQWGARGVPAQYLAKMAERAGGTAYPIRTVKELRNAIVNGFPCTLAGRFTPGSKYTADGRNCLRWNGRNLGGHQMCVLGYDGSPASGQCYFWIQNSHGPANGSNAAVTPMSDEPPGGSWCEWDDLERDFWPSAQCWALSYVAGFRANGIDWSQFDQFNE